MQIKTTKRYHLTPVRMTFINKSANDKCWWGCGEKGTLVHRWWECRLVQPLWRTVWNFLKKLKMQLPFDPVIPLLGIYHKKLETPIRKDICTPMFRAAQSTIARIWKQPVSRWLDPKTMVHLHNGILWCHKKEGILIFCSNLDGIGEHHAEWNNSINEGETPHDLTHLWIIKNIINWWTKR